MFSGGSDNVRYGASSSGGGGGSRRFQRGGGAADLSASLSSSSSVPAASAMSAQHSTAFSALPTASLVSDKPNTSKMIL